MFLCFAHVCFLIRRQRPLEMNLKICYVASTFSFKGNYVTDEAERQNSNFALFSSGICLLIEVQIMFRASFSLRVDYRIFQVQKSSHGEGNRSV